MNILFISNLTGNLWAGPNNSVPAQVLAQAKIDNVMWVNLNHNSLPQWKRSEYKFLNYDNIDKCTLSDLPSPFNKPDFIVCEEIYCYCPFNKMILSVIKSRIPYLIVPRSSLTFKAQKRSALKKKIANLCFYNTFIKKSVAIQYLTSFEKEESEKCFDHKGFIIPNGTYLPGNKHKDFSKGGIKGTYIGRLEINQKGLDLLVRAVDAIKDELRAANFTIELYGPNRDNTVELLSKIIREKAIEDILNLRDGVFGDEKKMILDNSDVFIMTSRFEGMPMGLIEALGRGVPCVVTKGTFFMKEIKMNNAGWEAGSTEESISEALLRVIKEKNELKEKSANARKLASHYSWDHLAEQFHKTIISL
ncbi:D-inositol-3-phosphate glycosyltransferase [Bacteroides pyogenes]|uniref:glycosyltransferase family 4 protein n=1 Tax=Bacteroides pyogenes TaxID=310300 RepID=UPI001BA494EC|nr:glycosyltransferase family 4 protein [Bacteroides pyogenes]MBR8719424.1 D-inositol-3-phosphate glycosyltransferase [Bacteroides pyogenes]MBR8786291.1 D-inositol-3-phosphate glycosyltransferase [Bacteroides pyogenes]MBR8791774.1 D-inositol-3-phosphate glycosyltransferase [Bacteroides pyogenes]MCF2708808.1 glycosyltransferase family 4 protein [Bacteroides pyogenes]